MRKNLFLLAPLLALAACTRSPDPSFQSRLGNPLFAEQYYSELVDHFVNLQIRSDPSMKDEAKKRAADDAREDALAKAQAATTKVNEGILGNFMSVQENTKGTTLIVDGMLYFGTDFEVVPGGDMHVYITSLVDPRNGSGGVFPDATAVDVGLLKSAYGTQEYVVPEDKRESRNLTVALWDKMLNRLHGFAQLRP